MNYREEYEKWCDIPYLEKEYKNELSTIKNDDEKIKNQFSNYVEFGTAGMRGTMGVGPNRMNYYTVRRTTLGVAKFIKAEHKEKSGVVIIYDTRNNSKEFANYIAKVLTEFDINVYVSKDVRPTPFLSYAVLNMKAFIGINITASHNRKEDNGYKIYLEDGAQFSYPSDQKIIKLVNEIKDEEIFVDPKKLKPNNRLIKPIPKEIENKFLEEAYNLLMHKDFCKKYGKDLCIVYTPLHGTGYTFLKDGFKKAGFTNVHVVTSQNDKCGEFKTLPYPNPETAKAFEEALKLANKVDADVVIATDPDADRMGVYCKIAKGKYKSLTGNELASILFEYKVEFLKNKIDFDNAIAFKSFVTTRLLDAIAKENKIEFHETPTGFKWIGAEINKSPKHFIFGAEESYGCVLSDYVRDKDAIGTTLFTCEVTLVLKKAGFTLYDILKLLYKHYGVYKCYQASLVYEGVAGKEKMANIMDNLRKNPPKKITDIDVLKVYDYETNVATNMTNMSKSHFDFPSTNTIKYFLSDDSVITIRPSGTEPKIKLYFDIKDNDIEKADNKFDILKQAFEKLLK